MSFGNIDVANSWLLGMLILCVAMFVGYLIHRVVTTVAIRLAHRTSTTVDDALIANLRKPVGLFLPASAALLALPFVTLPEPVLPVVRQALIIPLIAAAGWGTLGLLRAIGDSVIARLKIDQPDNLAERQVQTRVLVFNRIAMGIVVIFTVALILMTFPSIRHLGVSLFASAGVAGIVNRAYPLPSLISRSAEMISSVSRTISVRPTWS